MCRGGFNVLMLPGKTDGWGALFTAEAAHEKRFIVTSCLFPCVTVEAAQSAKHPPD